MIETFFLDWGFAFGTGLLFALAGRREHRAPDARAFAHGAFYLAAGILPIAIGFYVRKPDWMWMYWVDHATLPVAVTLLSFAMYGVAFLGGFATATWIARPLALTVALATGAAGVAGSIAARDRLTHFGSQLDYEIGAATRGGSSLAILAVTGACSIGLLVLLLVRLQRPRA